MAKPYSYDFRQKVIWAIENDGFKKSEVSEMFNISRNTSGFMVKAANRNGRFSSQAQSTSRS
ncbi:MAG: hypothetical protein EWV75_03070 [Microcystis wesenbergii Mw_QC_S_20081001_S30D]|jgi:transposase|uniref:Transposase n=1 Tax=Microcystis wesenbergii Mw_QC_S_20081001_S30D TaxID=2486245 RepID=A0A552JXI2_9CHRO|nr:hypothetical protein [Microcystis aeruginosa W11-03]NCR96217.1 hypothetical protein [Microcystis aeruginosa W11-06]TRV00480.1 MAG: hypothetical protein EWV75_03070 [Microcystis wesenbergii Mw_QC_S_20081001_S30D]TRV04980.1 MAG: hypothetical protein EWV73_01500 [Microcystis wesenbergii Mw_QC_B_20070930_S4D]TRV11650.1 MAG: hypothetical protein EWV89_14705 [Microcystis wesenbergii Mw_QC_B_20070930_S4]